MGGPLGGFERLRRGSPASRSPTSWATRAPSPLQGGRDDSDLSLTLHERWRPPTFRRECGLVHDTLTCTRGGRPSDDNLTAPARAANKRATDVLEQAATLTAVPEPDLALVLALRQPSAAEASLRLIEDLDGEISTCEAELRRLGADHRYVPLLLSAPGIVWVLAFTIAFEIGEIERFASPKKLCGYSGLCPPGVSIGGFRPPRAAGQERPEHLRWALIEATVHVARHPAYAAHHEKTKRRLGAQRGAKVARIEVACKLAEAIWYMLTRSQPFGPAGPVLPLVA